MSDKILFTTLGQKYSPLVNDKLISPTHKVPHALNQAILNMWQISGFKISIIEKISSFSHQVFSIFCTLKIYSDTLKAIW